MVEKYRFECEKNNSTWDTNASNFKTGMTMSATNLCFLQFTNKRVIEKTSLYVNPNKKQRYKIIFGLDFLIQNKFDFLLSSEMIHWQGIEISIHSNGTPRKKHKCANIGKK